MLISLGRIIDGIAVQVAVAAKYGPGHHVCAIVPGLLSRVEPLKFMFNGFPARRPFFVFFYAF